MFNKFVYLLAIITVFVACGNNIEDKKTVKILTNDYPKLYDAVFERDAEKLLAFAKHEDSVVARQAWRALMSTPVPSSKMQSIINLASEANKTEAWMAVAAQPIDINNAARLQRIWNRSPQKRKGISYAIGRAGFRQSLIQMILRFDDLMNSDYEFEAALAMSRIAGKGVNNEATEEKIVNRAFSTKAPAFISAYLYGFYRNGYTFNSKTARETLWEHFKPDDRSLISQYILKIVGDENLHNIDSESVLSMNIQMAVELSQLLGRTGWTENHAGLFNRLLVYPNPVVKLQALLALGKHPEELSKMRKELELLLSKEENEEQIWLEALYNLTLMEIEIEEEQLLRARRMASDEDFLMPVYYRIMSEVKPEKEFLLLIGDEIQNREGKQQLFAVNALGDWWTQIDGEAKMIFKDEVRRLSESIFSKGSRSSVYAAAGFLLDEDLYTSDDYPVIEQALKRFSLPGDIEVFQAFSGIIKQRYEDKGKPLIDSLAKNNYLAFNRFLKQQGWELPAVQETETRTFRKPDWEHLAELGAHPKLVLYMEKGTITIELDLLSAPVTISAIDSLVRAGAYEGTPFHRVVPNFVIQGGDIESGDGFGTAGFVVPTEASEKHFKRGVVGIASAGTDTESSQFFIMQQWKPHLNNKYTVLGEVIEGMDVVDRIMVGDRVISATIEK